MEKEDEMLIIHERDNFIIRNLLTFPKHGRIIILESGINIFRFYRVSEHVKIIPENRE